jgi:hypothetical protein
MLAANLPIDFRKISLEERFDHYNRLCFGGSLPKIKLGWSRSAAVEAKR